MDVTTYARPRAMTRLDRHKEALEAIPGPLPELVAAVQGLMIHPFHAHRYGVSEIRQPELQIRPAAALLDRILELDPAPLDRPRPPERRVFGNCRDFTTLTVALLRSRGRPARARCGFGAYFEPDRYADHWVCEVWDEARSAWKLVDAQVDDVQRREMAITADTLDLDREEFWVAGQAWLRARAGRVDPMHFGILDMWGLWFIAGNVVRDLAALQRAELLPWDGWGVMEKPLEGEGAEATLAVLDRAAEVATDPTSSDAALRRVYEEGPGLAVPDRIQAWVGGLPIEVAVALD